MGVSADPPATIERFSREKDGALYLVSDPEAEIIGGYDVKKPESNRAERSTYVVGADGVIRATFHKVKAGGHAADVLAAVRRLREEGRL